MDERGGRPRVHEGKEAVAGSNLRARLPPQPGRAGTALPGRQAMDPAGEHGIRAYCGGSAGGVRRRGRGEARQQGGGLRGEGERRELDAGEGGGRAPGVRDWSC